MACRESMYELCVPARNPHSFGVDRCSLHGSRQGYSFTQIKSPDKFPHRGFYGSGDDLLSRIVVQYHRRYAA